MDAEPFWVCCHKFPRGLYTPFTAYCGGSYHAPSLVWYAQVKSIVSTLVGIVVSILTQFGPQHSPSGPWRTMLLLITSTEPVVPDWLNIQLPRTSALAGFANSAKSIAGIIISQRLVRPMPKFLHPNRKTPLVLVLVLANRCCCQASMMRMVVVLQTGQRQHHR